MSKELSNKRIVLHEQTLSSIHAAGNPASGMQSSGPVYLLSPANSAGRRAKMLLNPAADFELARRLRKTGISLGEAFSFMSSLYFRGKLAYTATFSQGRAAPAGTLVITSSRGLLPPETLVKLEELEEISNERILADNPKYRDPLERDLRLLSHAMGSQCRAVLLGSIATKKYIPLLLEILADRLVVPKAFVGMGNMQRGALLLRCAREKYELEYVSVNEVVSRRSKHPEKSSKDGPKPVSYGLR
jgi:hypothetical protein